MNTRFRNYSANFKKTMLIKTNRDKTCKGNKHKYNTVVMSVLRSYILVFNYIKLIRGCLKNKVTSAAPIVVVEWITFLLRIREIRVSNLGPETGYPA
jgi:hypothetical protein